MDTLGVCEGGVAFHRLMTKKEGAEKGGQEAGEKWNVSEGMNGCLWKLCVEGGQMSA